ncbi:MAG TPA: hypothetical protein PLI71_09925 [Clostridia bacterium]|nr:hypothetical protein [Clostridia bacterium]
MKYQVKRNCGHTEEVVIYGSYNDREKKLEWLKTTDCKNCWQNQQLESAKISTESLPSLQGTQKQNDWATKIRAGLLRGVSEVITEMEKIAQSKGITETPQYVSEMEKIYKAITQIEEQNQSKFWIDNRNLTAQKMIKKFIA